MSFGQRQEANLNDEDGDGGIVWTTNEQMNRSNETREVLVSAFAYQLYHDIYSLDSLDGHLRASELHQELLKDFSVKLYHAAVDTVHKEAVSFVRENRKYVYSIDLDDR